MPHTVIKMFLSKLQINCKPIRKLRAGPRNTLYTVTEGSLKLFLGV